MPGSRSRHAPVDPRLWRAAPAFRRWVVASVLVGLARSGCLVAQATFLAIAVDEAIFHPDRHRLLFEALCGLVVAALAQAVLAFGRELLAARAAPQVKTELRLAALKRAIELGPSASVKQSAGGLAVTLGPGLDALDGYLGRYLPRLVLAVLSPVVLLAWIARLDLLSAGIILLIVALLPVFMVLVGQLTRARVAGRWQALTTLSGQFHDAVGGMATLRAFGRARNQRQAIATATDRLRRATMATLQISFLSAFVLETLAALGTALVAVPLGLRLLSGGISLTSALAILVLTPEVFLAVRAASSDFHASTDAQAALDATFEVLEAGREPASPLPSVTRTPGGSVRVELQAVSASYPGRGPLALEDCELVVDDGERVGIRGPVGAGKSTLVGLVLGLVAPSAGQVLVGERVDLRRVDLAQWRSKLAWVPQRPTLFSGSVADNLRVGWAEASDDELWRALEVACLAEVVGGLPRGLETQMGEQALRLSAGERQRLALARALVRRSARLVLLDEPTAHLDAATEAAVTERLDTALGARSLVVVSHLARPLALAGRVLTLGEGRLVGPDPDSPPPLVARP